MAKILFVPDPHGTTFELWANRCAEDLTSQVWFPKPNESRWKEWARQLFYSNDLVAEGVPDPVLYNDWREWARRWMVTQN